VIETTFITYTPEVQQQAQRIHAWLHIPHNEYDTQHEAMDHAHSIASRTKHRMRVYPVAQFGVGTLTPDQAESVSSPCRLWRIGLGKGPLS